MGLWLSLGGFHETGPDDEHIYNTHVIVNSEGEQVVAYHKLHLFDVDVDGGFKESKSTTKGEAAHLVKGRLALESGLGFCV